MLKTLRSASAGTQEYKSLSYRLKNVIDGKSTTSVMRMDQTGNCSGEISSSDGRIGIIKSGERLFMRFDDAYWESQGDDGGAARALVKERWIEASASDSDFEGLTEACDLDNLLPSVTDDSFGDVTGSPSSFDGVASTLITDNESGERTDIYVAADGEPRILKVQTIGGTDPSTITFFDFDEPISVRVPSSSETVPFEDIS
ncbi:hypothetical protein AB0H69_48360 [Streptomyces phaeochromogenes]|uniref:hypothetical protein n=1 Tax=Streptomyces phaeochromogenes TaxID=1923 RepID=UPI00340D264C|nr:hypothetical protein [Streptomyces phaeochromogenes]